MARRFKFPNPATVVVCLVVAFVIFLAAFRVIPILHENRELAAMHDIRKASGAVVTALSDMSIKSLFELAPLHQGISFEDAVSAHTELCLHLLKDGRDTEANIPTYLKNRLAKSYMEIHEDPWGNSYCFLGGPATELKKLGLRVPVANHREIEGGIWKLPVGSDDDSVYVFSLGPNGKLDQDDANVPGDDIGP